MCLPEGPNWKWVKTCTERKNWLTQGSTKQQITSPFTYEHMSLYCLWLSPLPSGVSPPRGEACVNICIPSRSESPRLWAMCFFFFACKHLEVCAKRADGQTVGCPTAVLVHARRSCIAGQRSRCWSPSTSQVCLPHHSLIHWGDRCQPAITVCNPVLLFRNVQGLARDKLKTLLSKSKRQRPRYPDC